MLDLAHDRDPKNKGRSRIYRDDSECPGMPPVCKWDESGRNCIFGACTKHKLSRETEELMVIARYLDAGMPIPADGLTREQWMCIGPLRMNKWPI